MRWRVCVCIFVCEHACMHVCASVYVHACACVCMCLCTSCSILLMFVLCFEFHRFTMMVMSPRTKNAVVLRKDVGGKKVTMKKRNWLQKADCRGRNGQYHAAERKQKKGHHYLKETSDREEGKEQRKTNIIYYIKETLDRGWEKKVKNRGKLTSPTPVFSAWQPTAFLVHTNQCSLNTRNAA